MAVFYVATTVDNKGENPEIVSLALSDIVCITPCEKDLPHCCNIGTRSVGAWRILGTVEEHTKAIEAFRNATSS